MSRFPSDSSDFENTFNYWMIQKTGRVNRIPDTFPNFQLDNTEITRTCKYLENPTREGVWFLTFYWINEDGISSDIGEEIENFLIHNENMRNLVNKKEILDFTNDMFSFIFTLFTYIYLKEKENLEPQLNEEKYIDLQLTKGNYIYLQIIPNLNVERIKEKYQEAYEIFKNEIYFDNFSPLLGSDKIFQTKDGIVIPTYKSRNKEFAIISLSYSPLEKIRNFLQKIGKIKDNKIIPEYSPEEKVFTPYFSFLEEIYPYFISDEKATSLFRKAINEYKDKNYEYCISTLGLIAENYLTQIYETFYREPIPKKLTLGQTYDLINNKVNNQTQNNSVSAPDINLLYEKANNLLSGKSEVDEMKRNQNTLELIRLLIHFMQEDKKHTNYLINNINKKESRISLFPENIKENITELIRHRNAISHNSRISIGQYEAQRMVYCCITLIMWWKNEKSVIDWRDDQKSIIEKTIERNKSSSRDL